MPVSLHLDIKMQEPYPTSMRTTLKIDDDVLAAARSLADVEEKTVGEVISELARKGLRPRPQLATARGFPVFSVPADASPITLETVRRALDEE